MALAPAARPARPPIRRRLAALTVASAAAAALFLPFLRSAATGADAPPPLEFVLVVTLVAALSAWPGLVAADATELPMPLLRAWELGGRARLAARPLVLSAGVGLALGALGVLLLRAAAAPALPGDAAARALSAAFAAIPVEVVVHLCAMSVAVRLARGRRGVGVLAAAAALVVFHLADAASQPAPVVAASVIGNGAVGAALGIVYAVYGFEYAAVGHAVAHLVAVLA